jgi:histone H3/H4
MPRFKQTVQKNFGATRAPFHRKNVMSADGKLVTKVVMSSSDTGVKTNDATQKNRRKFKPGTRAVMEIKKLQRSTELLVPKANFERMLRHTIEKLKGGVRVEKAAVMAAQKTFEARAVGMFENILLCDIHAHRKGIKPQDHLLEKRILGHHEPWEYETFERM